MCIYTYIYIYIYIYIYKSGPIHSKSNTFKYIILLMEGELEREREIYYITHGGRAGEREGEVEREKKDSTGPQRKLSLLKLT